MTKILVVDDEPEIVEELQELLDDEGYESFGAHSADEAFSLLAAQRDIAIVLTDIRMPGMDGLAMARKMVEDNAHGRDLHLIVMTGHAGMPEAVEALKIGAQDFLTKPLIPEQVLNSVHRAAELSELRHKDLEFKLRLAFEVKAKTREARALSKELAKKNDILIEQNRQLTVVGRLKDEFLGMISHELNTPLNGIIGFAEMLEEHFAAADDTFNRENAGHIITSARRLHKNVDTIIMALDAQAGTLKVTPQVFSVSDLLETVTSTFAKASTDAGVTLQTAMQSEDIVYNGDYQIVSRALGCLVDNAIKFSQPGATVAIDVKNHGRGISIDIADNGCGMCANTLAATQEPLRQGDGSLQRRHEGMGMGMTLTRSLIDLMDGKLAIASEENKGTTVTVILPTR